MLGFFILGLNIIILISCVFGRVIWWKNKWKDSAEGGKYAFSADEHVPDNTLKYSRSAMAFLIKFLAEFNVFKDISFFVEIVDKDKKIDTPYSNLGYTFEGKEIFASINTTRLLPFMKKRWVAVIKCGHNDVVVGRMCHEVIQHIIPAIQGKGTNHEHSSPFLDNLEKEAKEYVRDHMKLIYR